MMYVYCAPIFMSIKLTDSLTEPEIFNIYAGRRLFQNWNRPFYFAALQFCAVVNWRLNSIIRRVSSTRD